MKVLFVETHGNASNHLWVIYILDALPCVSTNKYSITTLGTCYVARVS